MSKVSHGAFAEVSKYEITQHKYVARDNEGPSTGYLELLEIKKKDQVRVIIHKYDTSRGSVFTEWDTLENAQHAFKTSHSKCVQRPAPPGYEEFPGFISWTDVGKKNPWFYKK